MSYRSQAMGLAITLLIFTTSCASQKDTAAATPPKSMKGEESKPIEVFTEAIAKTEIFDPVFFGGVVQAKTSSPLFSAVTGIVQKVYRQPGTVVKAGQKILSVRPQDAIGSDFLPHVVRAPIAGTLSRLDAQVGDLIRNDKHLGDVAQLGRYETVIQATYQDLFQFKKGMPVSVLVAVGSPIETMIGGKIVYISEQPEPDTGTYAVKVALECSQKQLCKSLLRLGSYLKVVLKQNKRKGYSIQKRALHDNNRKVLVMTKDKKAKWLDVKVGPVLGESIEITAGLDDSSKTGYQLVISFGRYPKEGADLVAGTKADSLKQFEEKPVHADSQEKKDTKKVKKG